MALKNRRQRRRRRHRHRIAHNMNMRFERLSVNFFSKNPGQVLGGYQITKAKKNKQKKLNFKKPQIMQDAVGNHSNL